MSRDSEDKETRQPQSKADNPFIKFRQYADDRISSLLQGIIGLPSVLSKSPGNTGWAHFDDELRRRDELQARQKELNDREARKAENQNITDLEASEIPVKKFPGWTTQPPSSSDRTANDRTIDEKGARDLPLYSPVSKSLFAQLNNGESDGGHNWLPIGTLSLYTHSYPRFTDPMTAVQYGIMIDLNNTPKFRSNYSLMPYLLFSPYSPLKLSLDASFGNWRRDIRTPDPFPYCAAFEDLILHFQGRPMSARLGPVSGALAAPGLFAPSAYHWIHHLNDVGILQQKEERTEELVTPKSILEQAAFLRTGKNTVLESNLESPQTEGDMYERFLRLVSPAVESAGGSILESIFADIEKEFKDPQSDYGRAFRWMTEEFKAATLEEERDIPPLSAGSSRDLLPVKERPVEEHVGKQRGDVPKTAPDPEKVISTTTTTEHTMDQDGTVETSITVWKRFADGRETVTTTRHTEDPARDKDGNSLERNPTNKSMEGEKQQEKKEPAKKGWFWN